MPLECAFKQRHGRQFCVRDCPASAPCGTFEYVRVERLEDVPPADPRAIDVLEDAGLRVRVLSFDVRRSGVLAEPPGSIPGSASSRSASGRARVFGWSRAASST